MSPCREGLGISRHRDRAAVRRIRIQPWRLLAIHLLRSISNITCQKRATQKWHLQRGFLPEQVAGAAEESNPLGGSRRQARGVCSVVDPSNFSGNEHQTHSTKGTHRGGMHR